MARQLSTSIWNSPALRQRAGNVLNVSQMHGGCSQLGLNLPDFACATVLDFAVLVEMDANRSGAICYTDRPWIQACSQNRVLSPFPTWTVTEALKKALTSGSTSICSCAQDAQHQYVVTTTMNHLVLRANPASIRSIILRPPARIGRQQVGQATAFFPRTALISLWSTNFLHPLSGNDHLKVGT